MSVFICYSHDDKDFVDNLARVLVRNKTHVWLDRWELNVGDSLIENIQNAITSADALLVVLSDASIKSEWCKRELSAGTMRELQEKRVLVLPVLIEDCEIPLLLREKIYADFRTNFGEGVVQVLEAVAAITSETLGRVTDKEYLNDFSISWIEKKGLFVFQIYIVSLPSDAYPYSILTIADITANESATQKLRKLAEAGLTDYVKNFAMDVFLNSDVLDGEELSVELKDSEPLERAYTRGSPDGTDKYTLAFDVRRLGEHTGKNILFHTGNVLCQIFQRSRERARQLSFEEMKEVVRTLELGKRN